MTELNLKKRKCIPCEKGGSPLSPEEIATYLKEVKAWKVIDNNKKIQKNFSFIDFMHALGFLNEVADMAEFEGHHPDLSLHDWNKVTITLSTHSMGGLSENDFIIAAKIDQILVDSASEAV